MPAMPSAEPQPQGATTLGDGAGNDEEENGATDDDDIFAFEPEHVLGRSRRPDPPVAPPADNVSSDEERDIYLYCTVPKWLSLVGSH